MAKKIKKAAPGKAVAKKAAKPAVKASKKAAVKKTATKKSTVSKAAVKKAAAKKTIVKKTVKKAAPKRSSPVKKSVSKKAAVKRSASRAAAKPAERGIAQPLRKVTITVTFSDVASGNSLIKATLIGGEERKRTSSGTIVFDGIKSFDIISINGASPGSTKVEIDVAAQPPLIESAFGSFHDNFLIL